MDLQELLITIQGFCGELVGRYGAWGVAAAMLLESTGVPFASTVVLLASGGMILSGRTGFWLLLFASTAGIISGSVIGYLIGYLGGSMGRFLGNSFFRRNCSDREIAPPRRERLSRVAAFMEKYGAHSILAGQLWGVTRTFISFPAGAMQMHLPLFVLYTALGGFLFSLWTIGWSVILTGAAGFLLRLLKILHLFTPWLWPALVLAALAAIALVIRLRRRTGR